MPAFLAEMLAQVKAIWARLDGGQRLTIGVVLLATIAGLGAVVWFAGRPDYRSVYTSTDSGDLTRAAQSLDGTVAYRLEGSSLMVESADVEAANRALLNAGLRGSSDAPDSDLTNLMSDRMTRMHALEKMKERDAEAKLERIEGVLYAQVSHTVPQRSPYRVLDPETRPRANVDLRLAPGVDFYAVAHVAVLQASAALEVPEQYVTVTNLATMATYSTDPQRATAMDSGDFLGQQRQRSAELTDRAQSMLDRVYPEKALVRVTVELDPAWSLRKERSAPDRQIVLKTRTEKEDLAHSAAAGGDPSVNAVGTNAGASASSSGGTVRQSKETEYSDAGYVETSTGSLAPDVRKISVAVLLDQDAVQDAERQAVEDLVKSAVGWKQGRDDIAVTFAKFPDLPAAEPAAASTVMDGVRQYGPLAAQLLATVLVLLFLRTLLKKPKLPKARGSGVAAGAVTPATVPEEELPPEEAGRRMRREIERAISDDPAAMSRLLESWLMETKL